MNVNNNKYSIFITLLFPFYGVLSFFRNENKQKFSYPLLIFFVFFGLLFVLPEGGDASRHFTYFQSYDTMSWSQFLEEVIKVVTLKSKMHGDLYIIVTNFFVSRFTSSVAIYFGFQALVYGTLFIFLFNLIVKERSYSNDLTSHLIFFTLFLVLSIAKIQYVRFFLAVMFFLYGCYLCLLKSKIKFWIYFVFAILVHLSLLIPSVLFIIYNKFKGNVILWFAIAILAYFSSNYLSQYSDKILTLSNQYAGDSRVDVMSKGYLSNEDYIIQRANRFDTRNWFTKYNIYMGNALSVASLFIFIMLQFGKLKLNHKLISIYTFSLFLFSLSQFGNAFASVGERFLNLFIFSSIYFLYIIYPYLTQTIKKILFIPLTPFLLLFVAMSLREFIGVASLFSVIGSPVLIPFALEEPINIYDFIFN